MVWCGASVSLTVFSCPRTEANPVQNECLSSAVLGGMLDMKQRLLEPGKLVQLFWTRREKNNRESLMTDGESACIFFALF